MLEKFLTCARAVFSTAAVASSLLASPASAQTLSAPEGTLTIPAPEKNAPMHIHFAPAGEAGGMDVKCIKNSDGTRIIADVSLPAGDIASYASFSVLKARYEDSENNVIKRHGVKFDVHGAQDEIISDGKFIERIDESPRGKITYPLLELGKLPYESNSLDTNQPELHVAIGRIEDVLGVQCSDRGIVAAYNDIKASEDLGPRVGNTKTLYKNLSEIAVQVTAAAQARRSEASLLDRLFDTFRR